MQEIIDEIVKIDSRVYRATNDSEERVKARQEYYENQMATYEKERLANASAKGEKVYNQIVDAAMQQFKFEEEKGKQIELLIENRYIQVEESMLEVIFEIGRASCRERV